MYYMYIVYDVILGEFQAANSRSLFQFIHNNLQCGHTTSSKMRQVFLKRKHEMGHEWVAIVLFLLLSESPTFLMAFCAHSTHRVRSLGFSPHLQKSQVYLGKRSFGPDHRTYSINVSKAQGNAIRRRRSCELHADAQGQASIPTSASKIPPASLLLTVVDRYLPFGRCVGVALPASLTAETLRLAGQELMPEELSYCLKLPPILQPGFLGGRLAIRRALVGTEAGSVPPLAILHNQDGAPVLPEGLAASISHKPHMAVALVQPGCEGNIGVDIELPAVRRRVDLRRRILTARECDTLGGVDRLSEDEEVLLRFSMKEAVYKAAHPLLRRPLRFKEVEVYPATDGSCAVRTSTEGAWGDLKLSAGWMHLPDVLGQPLFLTYCYAVRPDS